MKHLRFRNYIPACDRAAISETKHIYACHINGGPRLMQELASGDRFVLVTSGGDTPIDGRMAARMPDNLVAWYAGNVHTVNHRIHPIPIGIPSDATYGDFSVIEEFRATPKTKDLFACFCLGNNPPERVPAMEQARHYVDWTVQCFQHNEAKLMTHRDFIREMARHRFVLCPPGAQDSDTHRTWEALYLGCVPICKRSVFMEEFVNHFPIVLVDDWREVTPERLKREWSGLSGVSMTKVWHDLDRVLSLDYWVDKIKASIPCVVPDLALKPLEELFRAKVINLLVQEKLLPPERVQALYSHLRALR